MADKEKYYVDVNPEEWKKYTFKQKMAYFKQMFIENEGDIADSIMENLEGIMKTVRDGTPEDSLFRKYADLGCFGIKAIKFMNDIDSHFTREKVKVTSEYDYIIKYLKIPRENLYVDSLSINNEIIKNFVESAELLAKKGVFRIDKIEYDDKTKSSQNVSVTLLLTWGDNYLGIENLKYCVKCMYTIHTPSSKQSVSASGQIEIGYDFKAAEDYDFDSYDDISRIVLLTALTNYVDTVDTTKNYIKLEPYGDMRPFPHKHINFDIKNFDMKKTIKTMKKCLEKGKHRGYMFLGDPGTGKTVSIFKMLDEFPNTPVFWVDSSTLQSSGSIRDIYKTLHYFPNSICIFEDIDSVDLSGKSSLSTAFIECMDNKDDKMSYGGITIMTVNDPIKIHSSIKTRPERIDQIIYIKNPNTIEKVLDIVTQRYINANEDMPKVFSTKCKKFVTYAQKCIDNNFTHAHIASIIDDIITFNDELSDEERLEEFNSLIDDRIDSLKYANMRTKNGYFEKIDVPAEKSKSPLAELENIK